MVLVLAEDRETGNRPGTKLSRADIFTYEIDDVHLAQLEETPTYKTYTKLFRQFRVETEPPHFL